MSSNRKSVTIELLHRIATHPWIYDQIQTLAGQKQCLERISLQTAAMHAETIVDVGGGTGNARKLWPEGCRYVCLDLEMPKLQGFRCKVPDGLAVLSDATRMAVATESVDIVMWGAIVHHLTDTMLDQVLEETLRVLRAGGRLILLDPILNCERWAGRMLWRLDRGSFPRTAEELHKKLETRFKIVHWEKFAIYHEYVFGIGVRP